MSDFVATLKAVGEAMGVAVRRVDRQSVGGWRAAISLPPSLVIEISTELLSSPEHVIDLFDDGRRALFHLAMEHIAKHDRSPIDRLKQVEDLARATLPREPGDDTGDQRDLRHLLSAKPGSPSWGRSGYGKDPK